MTLSTMDRLTRSFAGGYQHATRSGTYGFLAALPLLILYETMMLVVGRGGIAQVRVGAEVWIKQLLILVGFGGMLATGIVVILIGIGVLWYERKKEIPLRPRYFGWMIVESAFYAVVLAILISTTVGLLFAAAPEGAGRPSLLTLLALSIGAGLYEELLFRVALVGGLYYLLRRFADNAAYPAAALIGAFVFSAVHYLGPMGDAFTLASFVFRFLFGLALNALFLWRGFGVAAWTHALYDVFVVTRLLG